jgi:hypothetical protein
MSKKVKLTEVTHQWEGIAIVREEGLLKEIPLGVEGTTLKLKETGAKELFKNRLPENLVALEVKKNADVTIEYEMESEEFKKLAKVVEPIEEGQQS